MDSDPDRTAAEKHHLAGGCYFAGASVRDHYRYLKTDRLSLPKRTGSENGADLTLPKLANSWRLGEARQSVSDLGEPLQTTLNH